MKSIHTLPLSVFSPLTAPKSKSPKKFIKEFKLAGNPQNWRSAAYLILQWVSRRKSWKKLNNCGPHLTHKLHKLRKRNLRIIHLHIVNKSWKRLWLSNGSSRTKKLSKMHQVFHKKYKLSRGSFRKVLESCLPNVKVSLLNFLLNSMSKISL